jgi:hypothetical protein
MLAVCVNANRCITYAMSHMYIIYREICPLLCSAPSCRVIPDSPEASPTLVDERAETRTRLRPEPLGSGAFISKAGKTLENDEILENTSSPIEQRFESIVP